MIETKQHSDLTGIGMMVVPHVPGWLPPGSPIYWQLHVSNLLTIKAKQCWHYADFTDIRLNDSHN